jgi:hypothetical protein
LSSPVTSPHQDAVEGVTFGLALVHEQDVAEAAGGVPGLLADADQIHIAVLVDVAPGVVFLLVVRDADGGVGDETAGGLVAHRDPVTAGGRPGREQRAQ